MTKTVEPGDQYSDEEAVRRAREAIRRSFQTPYKPQKKLVGKTRPAPTRKRKPAKASPEAK